MYDILKKLARKLPAQIKYINYSQKHLGFCPFWLDNLHAFKTTTRLQRATESEAPGKA